MKDSSWKPSFPPFRTYKKKVFNQLIATGDYIYHIGESESLREPSQAVRIRDITTPSFQKKLQYVKDCLFKYRAETGMGRGLAAVQVGIPERFAVIFMPREEGNVLTIINPEIQDKAKHYLVYPEICMSANPLIARVSRPAWMEFDYYDENGELQLWKVKDDDTQGKLYNRIAQHEIDHMNDIINIDKVVARDLIFEVDPSFYDNATFEEAT